MENEFKKSAKKIMEHISTEGDIKSFDPFTKDKLENLAAKEKPKITETEKDKDKDKDKDKSCFYSSDKKHDKVNEKLIDKAKKVEETNYNRKSLINDFDPKNNTS